MAYALPAASILPTIDVGPVPAVQRGDAPEASLVLASVNKGGQAMFRTRRDLRVVVQNPLCREPGRQPDVNAIVYQYQALRSDRVKLLIWEDDPRHDHKDRFGFPLDASDRRGPPALVPPPFCESPAE